MSVAHHPQTNSIWFFALSVLDPQYSCCCLSNTLLFIRTSSGSRFIFHKSSLGYERNADPFWISSFYGWMLAGARRPPRWRKERKQWNNWWYILVVPFYRQHHHSEQTTRWWWWCFKVESQEPQTQSFSQTSISIIFSALSTFLCTILHLLFAVIEAVVAKVCLLARVIRFFMSSSEAKKSNSRHNHSLLSLCLSLRFTFNMMAMAKKGYKDSERD